jgi:hypothetical protein
MTLHLTPDILRAAYDYLNETRPFSRWNLPPGEDVVFKVARSLDTRGWYRMENGRHVIYVSRNCIGNTASLMALMAHEMTHLHEQSNKACGRGEHSKAFWRWAAQICKEHGFDPLLF